MTKISIYHFLDTFLLMLHKKDLTVLSKCNFCYFQHNLLYERINKCPKVRKIRLNTVTVRSFSDVKHIPLSNWRHEEAYFKWEDFFRRMNAVPLSLQLPNKINDK